MSEDTGGPGPPDKATSDIKTAEDPIKNQNKGNTEHNFNNRYGLLDKGPYYVFVEHKDKNLGKLFPLRVGHYLFSEKTFKNDVIDITSVGINRVKVIFKTYNIANKLINHDIIIRNNLIAHIPNYFTQKKGVLRMVDTYFDEKYLLENIQSKYKVVSVMRMKRKITNSDGTTSLIPRQMVVVTFVGNTLPSSVQINLVNFPVEPYIYPVVQCFGCMRYGHTIGQCKGKAKCRNCSEELEENHTCSIQEKFCIFCETNDHISTSKSCPVFKKQYEIKKIMATENISFKEAEHLAKNTSYSKIVSNNRFAILNSNENFPPLQNTSQTIPNTMQIPTQRPRTFSNSKKRKAQSPIRTENMRTTKKNPPHSSKPIIPNPYRDEFMEYKEKILGEVTTFIVKAFQNPQYIKDNFRNEIDIQNYIRNNIENFIKNNSNNVTCITDDDDDYNTY